jgi:iron complex transport system substrate-binding protein
MNIRLFALLLAFVVGTSAATASAGAAPSAVNTHHRLFPVTVTDDTGVKVTIPTKPMRIVSLDPRDTETLFALNLESRVVADGGALDEGAFCCKKHFNFPGQWPSPWGLNYPARAKTLTHIEGGYDAAHPFDIELVESKHPGLVVSLNADPSAIQRMRNLGLKVLVLDPHSIAQILHDIHMVGRATGNISEAKVVVKNMSQRVAAVKRKLANVHTLPSVFYEIDDSTGTPYTACAGSFIDQMLTLAKSVNVAHDVKPCPASDPYPQMQTEAVVAANPKVILLGDSNYGVTAGQVKKRNGWQTISAVKHSRIYPIDDDLISRAGPREVIGLERVATLLHESAFHH